MVKEPILYIDDEKENLENFKLTFFRNYTIYTTQVAEDAYEILRYHKIKVVIADQRMPKISGVEFLSQVKKIILIS